MFCDYSYEYILVKEAIDLLAAPTNVNDQAEKDFAFENNAPFRSCISKINSTLTDNGEYLDIVMPMYNLLEYRQNYSMTSGSLRNYYRDKINDIHNNTLDGKSFEYKTEIVGKTPKRPGNERDANRPPVPTSHVEGTIHPNILLNFGDLLVCH